MTSVIATQPIDEPLSLEEAKMHLRVDIDDDDMMILNLITVARQYAEIVTGRALMTQTWVYYLDDWPEEKDYIELPFPPLQAVIYVRYTPYNSIVPTTLTLTTDYVVDTYKEPGRVVLAYGASWPTATLHVTSPIAITFRCGYGAADDVPMGIKQGILIDLATLYEQRESIIVGQPVAHLDLVDRIYMPYRTFNF